jgi:hypothetical protein
VFSDCINRTDANKLGQFFHGGRVTVLPDIEQQQVIYFLLSRREVLQRQKANCVFTLVSQWSSVLRWYAPWCLSVAQQVPGVQAS